MGFQSADVRLFYLCSSTSVCNFDFMLKSYAKIRLFPPAKYVDAPLGAIVKMIKSIQSCADYVMLLL